MSNEIHGVGLRMFNVRKEQNLTQAITAAKLDISTKTYIYYEQEKREIPASIAARFCNLFDIDIGWLLLGETRKASKFFWDQIEESFKVALAINRRESKNFSDEKLAAFARLIAYQSNVSSELPEDVAEAILKVM